MTVVRMFRHQTLTINTPCGAVDVRVIDVEKEYITLNLEVVLPEEIQKAIEEQEVQDALEEKVKERLKDEDLN